MGPCFILVLNLNIFSFFVLTDGNPDYASFVSKVQRLELKIQQISDLESKLLDANENIQQLRSKIVQQQEQIQEMTSTNLRQSERLDKLDTRLKTLVAKQRNNEISGEPTTVEELKSARHVHFKERSRSKRQEPGRVAFTAYVDHNPAHLGIGQIIPFNQIITNIGDGFDVQTGVFISPEPGIYLFTFVISENNGSGIIAKLVVDGVNQVDAIAVPDGHDVQGGNTAVFHLDQGQHVWVATYFQPDVSVRSDSGYRFASFTGVKLIL